MPEIDIIGATNGSMLEVERYPQLFDVIVGSFVPKEGLLGLQLWNTLIKSPDPSILTALLPILFICHLFELYAHPCPLP